MHFVHKKAGCGLKIATFRTKTLHFLRVVRLNWLAKIELRGARRPWSSILLSVTAVSEKCQKEIETEETIGFFVTFLSLVKFQLGGPAPLPHLATPMLQVKKNKKDTSKFSARFLAFSNKISTVQKIVLSSSRGHGNFRGLEASRPSQGLDLRGQGQELQNESSRTSSRTPPLIMCIRLNKVFVVMVAKC